MTRNSEGVKVSGGIGSVLTGDTGFQNSRLLFYCGRLMPQCRCGRCIGGRCGPNGCPCDSCVELTEHKVNRDRGLSKKYKLNLTTKDGRKYRAFLQSDFVYYCGNKIDSRYCSCVECPPTCGPFGCPCLPCLELISEANVTLRLNTAGFVTKKNVLTGNYHCQKLSIPPLGSTGRRSWRYCDTKTGDTCLNCVQFIKEPITLFIRNSAGFCCRKAPIGNFYCGRRVTECKCGSCNGVCGPIDGCPCRSCEQLGGNNIRIKSVARKMPLQIKPSAQKIFNRNGAECHRGSEIRQFGGDTGMLPKQLYYCGQSLGQCRCGGCNLRCGPEDGCPCNACFELVLNGIVNNEGHHKKVDVDNLNPTPSAPQEKHCTEIPETTTETLQLDDSKICIICLVTPKSCIVSPCGHFAYCGKCVVSINECAVCRGNIDSFMKVFEP